MWSGSLSWRSSRCHVQAFRPCRQDSRSGDARFWKRLAFPWECLGFFSSGVCYGAAGRISAGSAIRRGAVKLLFSFDNFVLDCTRRELRQEGNLVSVAPKVFDLLAHLVQNRERVVSRDDLIEAVWEGRIISESALATCINAARSAIADSGEEQRLIKTLPRKGIRFVGEVREGETTDKAAPA